MSKETFYISVSIVCLTGFTWLTLSYATWGTEFLFCPFKAILGLPCPLCGLTHACHYLLGGEFTCAILSNPLVIFAPIGLFVPIVIYDLFSHNQYTWLMFQFVHPKMRSTFYLILLTAWLYKIFIYKIGF